MGGKVSSMLQPGGAVIVFLFIITFTFIFPVLADAGRYSSKIVQVGAATSTYAVIIAAVPPPNHPACAALDNYAIFSFDKTTSHGRDMLGIALIAVTAGKPFRIEYSETDCGLWGNRTLMTGLI